MGLGVGWGLLGISRLVSYITYPTPTNPNHDRLKLDAAAEKAKKTLSPAGVTEASISVECLLDDTDLNVSLPLEEFEKRVQPLLARLEAPIQQALAGACLGRWVID